VALLNVSGGVPPYTFTVNTTSVTTSNGTATAFTNNDNLYASNNGGNTLGFSGTLGSTATTVTLNVSVQDSASHTVGPIQYSIVVNNATPLTFASNQNQNINYGGVGLPYTTYFSVSGGSGNSSNYQFTTINGTVLPPGLQWSTTCQGCVVGTPTTANTYSFTVQVSDSVTQQTASGTYQIVISAAPNGANNNYLYGHYAFEFQGVVDNPNSGQGGAPGQYQTAAIGSFFADGNGNITNGVVDITEGSTQSVGNKVPFAGTYSIGPDNRGILTLCTQSSYGQALGACQTEWPTSNIANASAVNNYFVFSVGSILNVSLTSGACPSGTNNSACPLYTDGFIIEADDAGLTPSTIHGGGRLLRQSLDEFNTLTSFNNNIAGSWVFGLQGEDLSSNPVASGGILSLASGSEITGGNYQGNVTSGTVDINDNNTNVANTIDLSVGSSNWQTAGSSPPGSWTTNNGRFKVSLSVTNAPTGYPSAYIGYMINSNQLLLLSIQAHNSTSTVCSGSSCMLVSGRGFKQQQASYGSINDGSYIVYMDGYNDAQVMEVSCTSGACTLNTNIENSAGTVYTNQVGGSGGSTLPPPWERRPSPPPAG